MFRKRAGSWLVLPVVWALCWLTPGCPKEVTYQHEAGSTSVTVLAVAPWDDVRESLEPKFEMDAQKALQEAIPTSANIQNMLYWGLGAKARVAMPTVTEYLKETETVKDGEKSSETTRTREEKAGEVATAPQGSVLSDREGLGQNAKASDGSGLQTDPLLRYMAATALLQEVRLLNQYLKYAPIAKDYQPYLVRLQINLAPNARNMPYDAYTTLSFFPYNAALSARPNKNGTPPINVELPRVVPMLVSDSLEAANYARSRETLLRLAVGLAAMVQGVGAEAELDNTLNKLKTATNNDLNSLFSVAVVTPNTLRVRIGAYRQAADAYTMVPRNHLLSFLLLVPKKYFEEKDKDKEVGITVLSKTAFVHATKGEALAVRSEESALRKVGLLAKEYFPQETRVNLNPTSLQKLLTAANNSKFTQFQACAKELGIPEKFYYALWLDLVSTRCGAIYAVTHIPILLKKKPEGPNEQKDRTAWLDDNGKNKTTVKVALALPEDKKPCPSGKDGQDCVAITRTALEIKTADQPLYLPAETKFSAPTCEAETKFSAPTYEAEFNSLHSWGFKAADLIGKVKLLVDWKLGEEKGSDVYPAFYHSQVKEEGQEQQQLDQFKIVAATNAIMAKDAKGTLNLLLNTPQNGDGKDKLSIQIKGADLQLTQPYWGEVAERQDTIILVKKSGMITLNLTNLKEFEDVTLTPMIGEKESKAVLTLPVHQSK